MEKRIRIRVSGVVQGVGFRPFVWRLARAGNLTGFVLNDPDGVLIEVQGAVQSIRIFLENLRNQPPQLASIDELETQEILPVPGDPGFRIATSRSLESPQTFVSPDFAPCSDCRMEMADPRNRRYQYPFTNCTNCGPRYTILKRLPYDRQETTMAAFPQCHECLAEYENPADRRFHAEPNACANCGPTLWMHSPATATPDFASKPSPDEKRNWAAIEQTVQAVLDGQVVAVKGVGGFHLVCDATNDLAVRKLRERKRRLAKPLAVMVADVETARNVAEITPVEQRLMESRQRPIVLVRKLTFPSLSLSNAIAPDNPRLGILLPCSPLHELMLKPGYVWVVTSGNLSEEPIATDNQEALTRLGGLADRFLMHDRVIQTVCDDSVLQVVGEQLMPIRRARGYAPLPITLADTGPSVIAVGGELKSTLCLASHRHAILSQHIGDLENQETYAVFDQIGQHLCELYAMQPEVVAADIHPGYLSSAWARRFARDNSLPLIHVQHHHAHLSALAAEHGIPATESIIGCCFDGTGFGLDSAIWGGEWLVANATDCRRYGHVAYHPLPGGDQSIRKPARTALAYLHQSAINWTQTKPALFGVDNTERALLLQQLDRRFQCTSTSSIGRLFDVIASLLGLHHDVHFEGQAAMSVEALAEQEFAKIYTGGSPPQPYPAEWLKGQPWQLDISELLKQIVYDVERDLSHAKIAARFHATLIHNSVEVCKAAREETGINLVGLTGGVFQNALLSRHLSQSLREHSFQVLQHVQVPANDGGLALGQAVIARACLARGLDKPHYR